MLLLLAACASDPPPDSADGVEHVDRWTGASVVCAEPSEACTARLREDFGVEDFDRVDAILEALQYMVVWDLGSWPPEEDEFVHAESVAPFSDWPGESTAAKVYNHAAAVIDAVVLDNERTLTRGGVAAFVDGVVYVSSMLASDGRGIATPTLVHEAAHAIWGGHVDCDGTPCDRSWAGAFGTGASVAWLAAERTDGMDAAGLRAFAEDSAEHVVPE